MASREERTARYQAVVSALIRAAHDDGCMERVAIAKAMDALGPILADVRGVLELAISFRNGPLLREQQPVSEYLRKDPEPPKPVDWCFTTHDVLDMDIKGIWPSIRRVLIREAYKRASHRYPAEIQALGDTWCGKARVDEDCFIITLYSSIGEAQAASKRVPEGLLPTILIEYEWLLGSVDPRETIELHIIKLAHEILREHKPDKFAKLTDDWWAKVECTHIGYLVTFHYDREFP